MPWVSHWVHPSMLPFVEERYGADRFVRYSQTGVRVEYSEDGQVFANEISTQALRSFAASEAGALWITGEWRVLRAPSVVGPVQPVGDLKARTVAVVGRDGYACTMDGGLVRIAMRDDSANVSPLPHACRSVRSDGESLLVEDAAGTWSRSIDGGETLEPTAAPQPERPYDWRFEHPTEFDTGPDRVQLAKLVISIWRDDEDRLFSVSGSSRADVRSAEGWTKLRAPKPSCRFFPSEMGIVAACSGSGSEPGAWFRYRDGWTPTHVDTPVPPIRLGSIVVSRIDGAVVLRSPCDLDSSVVRPERALLCIATPSETPRTLRRWTPAEDRECSEDDIDCRVALAARVDLMLEGYQHPYLLMFDERVGAHAIDVRDGEVAFGGELACSSARWVGPGWLACREPTRGSVPLELHRVERGDLKPVALPEGATSVAFASPHRGLATGGTAEALWTTRDGAQTWDAVEVPVMGDASRLHLSSATCTNVVCSARPFVWGEAAVLELFDLPQLRFIAPEETDPTRR